MEIHKNALGLMVTLFLESANLSSGLRFYSSLNMAGIFCARRAGKILAK